MTYKMLVYSHHARMKMAETGIIAADVRWLVISGLPYAPDTLASGHRFARRGYLGKREAEVLYIEDAHRILIRTVMWVY